MYPCSLRSCPSGKKSYKTCFPKRLIASNHAWSLCAIACSGSHARLLHACSQFQPLPGQNTYNSGQALEQTGCKLLREPCLYITCFKKHRIGWCPLENLEFKLPETERTISLEKSDHFAGSVKTGTHFPTLHPAWKTAARDGTSGIVGLVLNLQDRVNRVCKVLYSRFYKFLIQYIFISISHTQTLTTPVNSPF